MNDLEEELAEKKKLLEDHKKNRSKSDCVSTHTSESYMRSEMEIETLEDEIYDLEKRIKNN